MTNTDEAVDEKFADLSQKCKTRWSTKSRATRWQPIQCKAKRLGTNQQDTALHAIPDLSVNDLAFFSDLQQPHRGCPREKIDRICLTSMTCMNKIINCNGKNDCKIPHLGKARMEQLVMLPRDVWSDRNGQLLFKHQLVWSSLSLQAKGFVSASTFFSSLTPVAFALCPTGKSKVLEMARGWAGTMLQQIWSRGSATFLQQAWIILKHWHFWLWFLMLQIAQHLSKNCICSLRIAFVMH